jgi:hypothetical protein
MLTVVVQDCTNTALSFQCQSMGMLRALYQPTLCSTADKAVFMKPVTVVSIIIDYLGRARP